MDTQSELDRIIDYEKSNIRLIKLLFALFPVIGLLIIFLNHLLGWNQEVASKLGAALCTLLVVPALLKYFKIRDIIMTLGYYKRLEQKEGQSEKLRAFIEDNYLAKKIQP